MNDDGRTDVINIVVSDFAAVASGGGGVSRAFDARSNLEDLLDLVNEAEASVIQRTVGHPLRPAPAPSPLHLARILAEMRSKVDVTSLELDAICAHLAEIEVERDQLRLMTEEKEDQIQKGLHERCSLLEKVRCLRQQLSLLSKPTSAPTEKNREWEKLREEMERYGRSVSFADVDNTQQGLLEKVKEHVINLVKRVYYMRVK
jgi:hypothetical protein